MTLYGYFFAGTADFTALCIGLICALALYLGLASKEVTFDLSKNILTIYTHFPLKKEINKINIDEITKIDVVRGRGSSGGFWLIQVIVENKKYALTSNTALSKASLEKLLAKIHNYLNIGLGKMDINS